MTALVLQVFTVASAALALLLLPGSVELLMLTLAGIFKPHQRKSPQPESGRSESAYMLTVIVPAHNEELLIGRCIASLMSAEKNGIDLRLVVVAHNCVDTTAALARRAGATVLEWNDPARRGKGQALNHAFTSLMADRTAAFAVVDADSEVSKNFLVETVSALRAGADATQCRYVFRSAALTPAARLASLTSAAYNILRARGRASLGLSAGIYGNGFALSAETAQRVPYTSYSLTEDLEYHLALLNSGRRVIFLDEATVWSELPVSAAGAKGQRARWDGGRLRMALVNLPKLAGQVLRAKFRMLEPCLDLLLLPLVFHAILLTAVSLSPSVYVRSLGLAGLSIIVFHLAVAAFTVGDGLRDLLALAAVPWYVFWKIALMPRVLSTAKPAAEWIRTERTAEVKR